MIGGGVVGLAIAWRAAQRGLRVTLADPTPGQGATHVAAGMLTPLAEAAYAERDLFRLGIASLRRYPGFAAELTELTGLPTGLRARPARSRSPTTATTWPCWRRRAAPGVLRLAGHAG